MIPFTRIRWPRSAWAAFFVTLASAAFDAEYGARNDWPQWAATERMLTTPAVKFPSIASCATRWIAKKGERTFTVMIRSQSSGVVSRTDPRSVTAAALTSASTLPNRLEASSTSRTTAAVSAASTGR